MLNLSNLSIIHKHNFFRDAELVPWQDSFLNAKVHAKVFGFIFLQQSDLLSFIL